MLSPMANTVETLGDRLRRSREDAGLSQEALARALGVTRSAISQAELGMTNSLNAENLVRAARRLGKNALWLATGEGPEGSTEVIGDIIGSLPDARPTLDYLLYQIKQSESVFGGDRAAHYAKMIQEIMEDMERRKRGK